MEQVGALRRATTPIDHLLAEMAASPIASVASLELALTELESWLPNRIAEIRRPGQARHGTAELWRRTEGQLLQAFPAVSLDELVAIRDMLWFQRGASQSPTIGRYLQDLAAMFLEPAGSSLRPALPPGHLGLVSRPPTSAASRRTLRWLALAIPPDLLCAAAARGDDALELALTNTTVDQMLRLGGFAETHLHLGAALTFDTIWHALVGSVGAPDFSRHALVSPGAELDEGRELTHWLIRAAVARLILAWYLRDRTLGPGRGHADGQTWIRGEGDLDAYVQDRENWVRIAPSAVGANAVVAQAVLDDLRCGSLDTSGLPFALVQQLYRRLSSVGAYQRADRLADVGWLDPLSSIFAVPPSGRTEHARTRSMRTPEQRFVGSAIKYIETHQEDRCFAVLFWQVVRVRCLLYRHMVQRPLTPGLQWFVRFYARSKPARARLNWRTYLDAAAQLDGDKRGLRSLEVRRSPDDTLTANMRFATESTGWAIERRGGPSSTSPSARHGRDRLAALVDEVAPRSVDAPEFGIVLHFSKDRGGGARVGLPSGHWAGTHADPTPEPGSRVNMSGLRYANFYVRRRAEAVALARLLQRWPRCLFVIRGLDVCTDELGVPSWVIRPLLTRVRSAAELAGTALDRLGEGPAPALQTTVHAGEDFVHLATGLRGVDQAIEHLGLGEGDRIGHGIALGVDASAWAHRTGRVAVPREVRIKDLLWEWSWIAAHGGGSVPRHAFIEREISRLTEMAFGQIIAPYELELLQTDLLNSDLLWRVGWPHGAPPGKQIDGQLDPNDEPGSLRRRRNLMYQYLSDPDLFEQGRAIEWIDPSPEAEALEFLQQGLREKVATIGLTVEVNPTSNLLIGDLGSLAGHPMWRLDPPVADPDMPPVAICVGSDDPLTFASSLIEEYNVLYDGLLEGGLTDAAARDWLERVRRRGLESRFTCDIDLIQPITELPNPLRDYPSQIV